MAGEGWFGRPRGYASRFKPSAANIIYTPFAFGCLLPFAQGSSRPKAADRGVIFSKR